MKIFHGKLGWEEHAIPSTSLHLDLLTSYPSLRNQRGCHCFPEHTDPKWSGLSSNLGSSSHFPLTWLHSPHPWCWCAGGCTCGLFRMGKELLSYSLPPYPYCLWMSHILPAVSAWDTFTERVIRFIDLSSFLWLMRTGLELYNLGNGSLYPLFSGFSYYPFKGTI